MSMKRLVNLPSQGSMAIQQIKSFANDFFYLLFWSDSYRIGPFEVESALIEHDAVAESAVVSSPDPVRHEVSKTCIVILWKYIMVMLQRRIICSYYILIINIKNCVLT